MICFWGKNPVTQQHFAMAPVYWLALFLMQGILLAVIWYYLCLPMYIIDYNCMVDIWTLLQWLAAQFLTFLLLIVKPRLCDACHELWALWPAANWVADQVERHSTLEATELWEPNSYCIEAVLVRDWPSSNLQPCWSRSCHIVKMLLILTHPMVGLEFS